MQWRESLIPVRMERVALVCREADLSTMLDRVADSGAVELDLPESASSDADIDTVVAQTVVNGDLRGLVGWVPDHALTELAGSLATIGAAAVVVDRPAGVDAPTLILQSRRAGGASRLLVDTYGTVPYADLDPKWVAGASYVVMFGVMFGDVGHGAMLAVAALLIRSGRVRALASFQKIWGFVLAAAIASMITGALYGEAFGPTGLVPVLWLAPLDNPIPLMLAALVLGAILTAAAYTIGTINRVREGGWRYAIYARTGIAGSLLFLAVPLLVSGILLGSVVLITVAAVLAAFALVLVFVGLFVDSGGGATGVMQASIELFDTVIRLGSNLVSFARLAAFGLTHAALAGVTWTGTVAVFAPDWRAIPAVLIFIVGTVITFGLEALVAGIQALRLEYYELFSRIFQGEGRAFRPWKPATPSTDLPAALSRDASSIEGSPS